MFFELAYKFRLVLNVSGLAHTPPTSGILAQAQIVTASFHVVRSYLVYYTVRVATSSCSTHGKRSQVYSELRDMGSSQRQRFNMCTVPSIDELRLTG